MEEVEEGTTNDSYRSSRRWLNSPPPASARRLTFLSWYTRPVTLPLLPFYFWIPTPVTLSYWRLPFRYPLLILLLPPFHPPFFLFILRSYRMNLQSSPFSIFLHPPPLFGDGNKPSSRTNVVQRGLSPVSTEDGRSCQQALAQSSETLFGPVFDSDFEEILNQLSKDPSSSSGDTNLCSFKRGQGRQTVQAFDFNATGVVQRWPRGLPVGEITVTIITALS